MAYKHTPKPWFIQPGSLTIYNLSNGDTGLSCAVASVLSNHTGKDAAKANAHLIAAAPDLLEALQEVVDAADGDGWNQIDPLFPNQRAAIAKARGEK